MTTLLTSTVLSILFSRPTLAKINKFCSDFEDSTGNIVPKLEETTSATQDYLTPTNLPKLIYPKSTMNNSTLDNSTIDAT